MTLRENAKQNVAGQVMAAEVKKHERNFQKLHIYRDGSVDWNEYTNRSDDTIDRAAPKFAAIPSVICVGTGSIRCNCDWCEDGRAKKLDMDQVRADCAAEADLGDMELSMMDAVDNIDHGYFDDETVAAE